MALANDATNPTVITLVLRDEDGVELTKDFVVPAAVWSPTTGLIADLKTIRDNLVTAFATIYDGLIYRAFIRLSQTDDTSDVGPANSKHSEVASVVFRLNTAGKYATYEIPAPDIGIFSGPTVPQRNVIDTQDGGLTAFAELFSDADGVFTISDGETITDTTAEQVKGGKRLSRKLKLPTS